MPIYEYKCLTCGKISEEIKRYDEPAPVCEDCKNKGLPCEMLKIEGISKTSFVLKGSCWSRDGYKR